MLAALEAALALVEHGARLVNQLRAIALQTGELTPVQDAEYVRRQEAVFASWQKDVS